jgi:hypothetical protein
LRVFPNCHSCPSQVLIQSKLEDVIESLQQAKIMCKYNFACLTDIHFLGPILVDLNCNREITILNRIDIESLFKKYVHIK